MLSWSYGGQTAARIQEEDERILGVVGLDAKRRPGSSRGEIAVARAPRVAARSAIRRVAGSETASTLQAPYVIVALPELAHGNFNAMEGFLPGLFGTTAVFQWSTGGDLAVSGYRALVRVAVQAVDVLTTDPSLEDPLSELVERLDDGEVSGDVAIDVVGDNLP